MKSPRRLPRSLELVILAVTLCLVFASCRRKEPVPASQSQAQPPVQQGANAAQRVLYYPAGEDLLLAPCTVSMVPAGTPQQDMAAVINRYLDGPPCDGQVQPFLEHSSLRALYMVGSEAVVDLTGPVRTGGGSSTETARVYGIVQTLVQNFPQVRTVRILVDGQEVDTLLGHLDLSRPLVPEPRLLVRSARTVPEQGEAR